MHNDGLIQRFQLATYPDTPNNWEWRDQAPDIQADKEIAELLQTLASTDFLEFGASRIGDHEIPYFQFSDDAQERYKNYSTEFEKSLRNEESSLIQSHLAKYRSLVPSLALIIHLCDAVTQSSRGPVSLLALERAIEYAQYLETHARRIYSLAVDTQFESAIQLARKLKAGSLNDGFTLREVYRNGWHCLKDKESAQNAIEELTELGWLISVKTDTGKQIFKINPRIDEIEF